MLSGRLRLNPRGVLDVGSLGTQYLKIRCLKPRALTRASWVRVKQVPSPMLPADGALTLGRSSPGEVGAERGGGCAPFILARQVW